MPKNIFLLIISLVFYAWGDPLYLILLVLNIAWNYCSAKAIETEINPKRKKILFWIGIAVNLGLLGIFKYTDFVLSIFGQPGLEVGLPIGLSFYTFSALSYLIDVYRNSTPAQGNPIKLGLYIAFFGKVTSGPIVFYKDMEQQLDAHPFSMPLFLEGLNEFVKGLIKKVLIADQMGMVFSFLASDSSLLGTWLYALSYMFQIYFDFSGYSDMAIGLSKLFGFRFKPNFDHPYMSKTVQEFWRRWHISLGAFFRDYVYIPLGGNRSNYIRNILIVWFLTGLWHGANWTFIFWGLYYGALLLLEKYAIKKWLEKLPSFVGHIYTLIAILIGWIFFFSPNIQSAFGTIAHLFNFSELVSNNALFVLKTYALYWIFSIVFSTNAYDRVLQVFYAKKSSLCVNAISLMYILLFIVCIAYLVSSTYQSFLYFAF